MPGPLDGLRVVDFSRVLAGPHCAKLLRDLGAEVIKVEPPAPDVSRFSHPRQRGMSGYYAQQNSGKRNVSINLWADGSRQAAMRLCETADVIVENFRAGTLTHFGLGYDAVAERNPGVVYVSITGYGQDGPWQSRMAYAPTVQAEVGFTENSRRHYGDLLTDWRSDSLSHADVYSGMQAAVAVLAALHRRAETGRGQYIDVSMAATLLYANERMHVDGTDDEPGSEPPILGATDCPFFEAPGGERVTCAASLVSSLTFPRYLGVMHRPDLARDPRFATARDRLANLEALHGIVQTWMRTFRDIAVLDAQLDSAKLAMGAIRSTRDLADTDWARHWGAFATVDDRRGGSYPVPGTPWHFSHDTLDGPGTPAFRGEHNREVLTDLGYSDTEVDALVAAGALVGDVPTDRSDAKAGPP